MAHFTPQFRKNVLFPITLIFLVYIYLLIIVLTTNYSNFSIIILFVIGITIIILIKEISIKNYKRIRLEPGTYRYSPGKDPSNWHKKMGYLRLLEIITPNEYRLNLYRKCGAKVGNNVVLAGKILEPDMTSASIPKFIIN